MMIENSAWPRPVGVRPQTKATGPYEEVHVGDQKDFWVWDTAVMPPVSVKVHATCKAVGEEGYVFVDDAVMNKTVSDADVAILDERFHRHSPAGSVDPQQGVAALDHAYFGHPALGLDNDPHSYILLTEFKPFHGTVMDGMVNGYDAIPDAEAWEKYEQHSNEKEVLYLNTGGQPIAGDYMQGVMAHEYQHLCHNAADPEEDSWLNEMVSEVAMKVNGYQTDIGHVKKHLTRPERPLVTQSYVDYGACYLFGAYLQEKFGKGFFPELVANPEHGAASIDSTLASLGRPERFHDLCRDWFVANYADSRNVVDPGLHYATLDLPRPAEVDLQGPFQGDLEPTGVRYVRTAAERVKVGGQGLDIQLLRFTGSRMERTDLQPDADGILTLPPGDDRVLVVGNLGAEKTQLTLEPIA